MATEDLESLSNADWQQRFAFVCRCAETVPPGALVEAKNVQTFVNDAAMAVLNGLLSGGLSGSVGKPVAELQGAIYAYIRKSNPDRIVLSTIEYWGEHIDGPTGEDMRRRVVANLKAFDPDSMKVEVIQEDQG